LAKKTFEEGAVAFTKTQLILSQRYKARRDLLNTLLTNSKSYSLGEVDRMIDTFLKGKVK